MNWNRKTIKLLAKDSGISYEDLIALSPQNDPFYMGGPSKERDARWFTKSWDKFGYSTGVHLRRVHYQIVSQPKPVKLPIPITWKDPETKVRYETDVYINNHRCWKFLCRVGKAARYLGMVPIDAFVDRRNPEAIMHVPFQLEPGTIAEFGYGPEWDEWERLTLPKFPPMPTLEPSNEHYNTYVYHLEVWAEKSTMNDVLIPVCRQHSANLITGLGDLSITAVWNLYKRIENAGRPARIFYISDFDGKGDDMPVGISRKLEWFIHEHGSQNAKLRKLVLTRDQVEEYDLPSDVMKIGDSTKDRFESVHGGATELDALEALHPGELGRIVSEALHMYSRKTVKDYLGAQFNEFEKDLRGAESGALGNLTDEYENLVPRHQKIIEKIKPEIEALNKDLDDVRLKISDALDEVEIDPDDYLKELDRVMEDKKIEEETMLFESERDYLEQVEFYKKHKTGFEI